MRNIFGPMVLLLDKSPGGKTTTTNVWLQRRGYQVKQVECLTDVIENTIDFTLGVQPSLILLNCGQGDDVCEDRLRLLQEITESKNLPIIALAGLTESFIGDKILTIENLEALQPLLNNLLTKSYSKAA